MSIKIALKSAIVAVLLSFFQANKLYTEMGPLVTKNLNTVIVLCHGFVEKIILFFSSFLIGVFSVYLKGFENNLQRALFRYILKPKKKKKKHSAHRIIPMD